MSCVPQQMNQPHRRSQIGKRSPLRQESVRFRQAASFADTAVHHVMVKQ